MPTMFEEEPKARCPDCSQSLTFIRTKSHQKRWYCYACEKYIDRPTEPTLIKDAHARIEAITGLQVIDSHGMIVGRVRKAISNDTGDVRSSSYPLTRNNSNPFWTSGICRASSNWDMRKSPRSETL